MDFAQIGITGLIVTTVVGALKEWQPSLSGNQTRLVALVVGGLLGYAGQVGFLPISDLNLLNGIIAGATSVGLVTVADRLGTIKK